MIKNWIDHGQESDRCSNRVIAYLLEPESQAQPCKSKQKKTIALYFLFAHILAIVWLRQCWNHSVNTTLISCTQAMNAIASEQCEPTYGTHNSANTQFIL